MENLGNHGYHGCKLRWVREDCAKFITGRMREDTAVEPLTKRVKSLSRGGVGAE